jgi:hypothetical protein
MDNRICVTVNVPVGSQLKDYIANSKKHLIQELSIKGYYYAFTDDTFIKSICNTIDYNGKRTGGQLEVLDLSKAHLVLCINNENGIRELTSSSFEGCITLKIIKLGELDTINAHMFSGCVSLESIWYESNVISRFNGYKHSLLSDGGILYERRYTNDGAIVKMRKLIKYPSAHKETKEIKFHLVDEIADYAFENFRGTDLYLSTVPPSCNKNAFYEIDTTKITIHIPKGTFNSYWSHPVWGDFQIVEEE